MELYVYYVPFFLALVCGFGLICWGFWKWLKVDTFYHMHFGDIVWDFGGPALMIYVGFALFCVGIGPLIK